MRTLPVSALLLLAGCVISLRDPATQEPSPEGAPTAAAAPSSAPAGATGAAPAGAAAAPAGGAGPAATGPTGTSPAATTPGVTNPGAPAAGQGGTMITSSPPATESPLLSGPETVEEKHISRSVGEPGGVLVFWPRIIPRDIVDQNRELAGALQRHVRGVVQRALPGRPIDFRPEPERVCPKGGCDAVSVGILLSRDNQGCLVLALISRPGESPTRLIPWAGKVALKQDTVPFRDYPEGQVSVVDYVPCTALLKTMDENESAVITALREASK